MQMPEMDGVSLSKLIKEKYKNLPIILLSSVGDESKKKYPELFTSVLTKPVKPMYLEKILLEQFRRLEKQAEPERKSLSILSKDFAANIPLNILVAEDNLINQKMILRVLEKLGYKADLATTGREVIQMLDSKFYELILMDVQMPEMDGLEATRYIREYHAKQPIIFALTANAMIEDREECLKAGMDNYIPKPVKIEILIAMLKETDFSITIAV
jgi:CheY-like chemotaxis protein